MMQAVLHQFPGAEVEYTFKPGLATLARIGLHRGRLLDDPGEVPVGAAAGRSVRVGAGDLEPALPVGPRFGMPRAEQLLRGGPRRDAQHPLEDLPPNEAGVIGGAASGDPNALERSGELVVELHILQPRGAVLIEAAPGAEMRVRAEREWEPLPAPSPDPVAA